MFGFAYLKHLVTIRKEIQIIVRCSIMFERKFRMQEFKTCALSRCSIISQNSYIKLSADLESSGLSDYAW